LGATYIMATKKHRDPLSLLDLLRSLVGMPPAQKPSKVARPGARTAPPVDAPAGIRAKAGFGQRGLSTKHR